MPNQKTLSTYCSQIKADGKKALVTYVTAGIDNWKETIEACFENGADVVEVGLPFSDPTMDGPIIAQASYKSIENGSHTLELLSELKEMNFEKPLVVMTYMNVLFSHGLDLIVETLGEANISGLIIPDLSYESSKMLDDVIANTNIAHIQLVSATTVPLRRTEIVKESEGFTYTVALKGITGQQVKLDEDTINFFSEIQSTSRQPAYCGIGIRTPEQAKEISKYSDGIIVGSSIVEMMMDDPKNVKAIGKFVKTLRDAIDD